MDSRWISTMGTTLLLLVLIGHCQDEMFPVNVTCAEICSAGRCTYRVPDNLTEYKDCEKGWIMPDGVKIADPAQPNKLQYPALEVTPAHLITNNSNQTGCVDKLQFKIDCHKPKNMGVLYRNSEGPDHVQTPGKQLEPYRINIIGLVLGVVILLGVAAVAGVVYKRHAICRWFRSSAEGRVEKRRANPDINEENLTLNPLNPQEVSTAVEP